MSRCFPYPPPGYTCKGARGEAALIESIKLQSARAKCKSDRKKDKSKDKKRKTKEHKAKSRDICDSSRVRKHNVLEAQAHEKYSGYKEKSRDSRVRKGIDLKAQEQDECKIEFKNLKKGVKDEEAEQVEKSGLTEEHGRPIWPQSPGYLSDGTHISHKRKRDAAQLNESCQPTGRIIRIKLTQRIPQQLDPSVRQGQTCSTSGHNTFLAQKRNEQSQAPIQAKLSFVNSGKVNAAAITDASSKPRIEGPGPVPAVKEIGSQSNTTILRSSRTSAESRYEALFETLMPPPPQLEQYVDIGNEEWLFGTRQQDGRASKTNKDMSHVPSCRSSSLWPRAQYLAEADISLLPYTIPF